VDAEEFDAFYVAVHPRVVRAVYAMTGDAQEAQDVAQEAFVRAWDHRRSLDRDGNPEAWVTTAATRLAVSRWRRLRRGDELTSRGAVADLARPPSADHVDVVRSLRRLPDMQREAIVLFYLCDMTVEQVALAQRVPVGTVKARLSRGRAALAPLLTETQGAGDG
jgi:RNA polymerase sigma-70 factor, ECF subfamily